AGRQAVPAKAIVDATDRAWVARMAGAQARPFPAGEQTLRRVVIGGEARTGANMTARAVGQPWVAKVKIGPKGKEEVVTRSYQTIEYTLRLPMQDGSYASWAKAEQAARDLTYHPEQQFASDVLFQAPPDPIKGQKSLTGGWQGIDKLDVAAFRPAGVPRLYVLSGCADVSREQAEKLLRPTALIEMGSRIGAAAAAEAKQATLAKASSLRKAATVTIAASGDAKESLAAPRPWQKLPVVSQEERALPVLGAYDVVVVGGGTSGAPAGIAAARQGAKTLVVEYLHGLGGVGTLGLITIYCAGNRVGFTKEVQAGQSSWEVEPKMEWWRTELRKAGGELWFGALGCGAFVDGRQVKGVIVATPEGRGVALAKVVIDSTGNSDIAAAAGAACVQTDETDLAMQGTGLPFRNLGSRYVNTDFTVADETDMLDVWHLFVYAKTKYKSAFDLGQLIDTRERRRIVGDFTMTLLDQINKRTYPDTIVESQSPFDTHGYAVDPYCALATPPSMRTHTPYRCLLPRGWDGILVTGLGMSAHRDAMPVLRMQPDLQNQGYAAGVAAAMAARKGVPLRGIDIRELQKHLVDIGNLPPSVLTDKDSYPIPTERLMLAVENVRNGYKDVGTLLASPEQALPLLQDAYEAGAPK
ncbi:MAG: FAD-dependent oxidoreductase, partial [Planctomycetes bacterium]|nr:FAD-dependent oxidoreductase [Planctomycetota bacterium]